MIDGREWLLHQAFSAFRMMTGRSVPRSLRERSAWRALDRPIRPKANIALVGFSGVGKTTVGRRLAGSLGFDFFDTDAAVERRTGTSIMEIFRKRGEPGFRELERTVIHDTVAGASRTVFAVGGGGLGRPDNRAVLRKSCLVVWLWAPLRACLERVAPGSRPLLDGGRIRSAEWLFAVRKPVYARSAELAVACEGKTVEGIAERIRNEIDRAFPD